ncbi:hypothetical protein GOB94_04635 [Granulicella sp. 5B5]|nr:hypothetical protein GOB94_04635 [Granulicella sp. 5B5]
MRGLRNTSSCDPFSLLLRGVRGTCCRCGGGVTGRSCGRCSSRSAS